MLAAATDGKPQTLQAILEKMQIKNQSFSFLIKANLIFILILYTDLLIPSISDKTERFKSFYNSVDSSPGWKSGSSKSIKYLLECESGNVYYLGKFPKESELFVKGIKMSVEKTLFLKKVRALKIEDKKCYVSFLLEDIVEYIFIFCFVFNLLNVFFENKILEFMLPLATLPIYFIGLIYLFSY